MNEELELLLADYLDGTLDAQSMSRLRGLLGENGEFRRAFKREVRMQVLMREAAGEILEALREVRSRADDAAAKALPRQARASWRAGRRSSEVSPWMYALVPLAAAAVVAFAVLIGGHDSVRPAPRRSPRKVAVFDPDDQPPVAPIPRRPLVPVEPAGTGGKTERAEPGAVETVGAPNVEPPVGVPERVEPPAAQPANVEPAVRPEPRVVEPVPARPVAVAKLERVSGKVFVFTGSISAGAAAVAGQDVFDGQTVLTTGTDGKAALSFADSTAIELAADTEAVVSCRAGKRIVLARGGMSVTAAKQPDGEPMVVATPHAEAKVLGTMFTVRCDKDATNLTVDDGLVLFAGLASGMQVKIPAGFTASAAKSGALEAKPFLGQNLIADGSFEGGGQGWDIGPGQYTARPSIAAAPARSGRRSLQLPKSGSSPAALAYARVRQCEKYEVIVWVKTDSADAEVLLVWQKASGLEFWGSTSLGKVAGTSGWTRIAQTVTSPDKARTAKIVLQCSNGPDGSGSAYFDDVYLGERLR